MVEVNKADGNVWISLVDFFVIGIGEIAVLDDVVLVVSVVVVRSSVFLIVGISVIVVVVVGFVVVVSGMYT